MTKLRWTLVLALLVLAAAALLVAQNAKIDNGKLLTGRNAFGDAAKLTPGNFHKITPTDLPKPFDTQSASNAGRVVARPADAWPKAPAGFKVELYVSEGLDQPRQIRMAPNGDYFVADSSA